MAVLLSGSGRTLDNFHSRIQDGSLAGEIQVVISNVKDVLGLSKAEKYGYPSYYCADNDQINQRLADFDIERGDKFTHSSISYEVIDVIKVESGKTEANCKARL